MQNLLVVSDDIWSVKVLTRLLHREIESVNVVVVENYKEALKVMMSTMKIHASILDLDTLDNKVLNIIDFALEHTIPCVVMTSEEEVKDDILDKDIIDYVEKEGMLGINNIVKVVKRILNNYNTNVLVVDDSKLQLSAVVKILKKLNLNIFTASDGEEALSILETNEDKKFSLVITDYHMPNMDGMKLTLKLRKKYQKDTLGIIVLSSNNTPEISTKFIKIGANDFMNKPYSQIEVITRINSNLDTLELFDKTRDVANKDFMTGAYNRRFFFESGEKILKKAKRTESNVALAMIDIDKFKTINDTYGHDVGDIAICEVVNILNNHLRASDLMARFGGEEFCVLLDNISLEDSNKLFEKIRGIFESNVISVDSLKFGFTVSIGIYHGAVNGLETMIKVADDGLYFCKNNGRNQISINKSSHFPF